MRNEKNIYYINAETFKNDIILQFSVETWEEIRQEIIVKKTPYSFNGFISIPLVEKEDNSALVNLIISYYKDIAPIADILLIDRHSEFWF